MLWRVTGRLLTRGVLVVDLSPPGFIRSAGTREYRCHMLWSWQKTDRFGDKWQYLDAMAEHFASRWWCWHCVCMSEGTNDSDLVHDPYYYMYTGIL